MAKSVVGARRLRLDPDDRRDRILAAAQRMFAQRPYESVSASDVAAAAGTTRTNLHYYFGTKHNLFLEVVRRFAELPLPSSAPTLDATASRYDVVSHVLGLWLDLVEENSETFLVMVRGAAVTDSPEIQDVLTRSMLAWESRLLRLLGVEAPDDAARAAIRAFQAMIRSACDQWLRTGVLSREDVHCLLSHTALAVGEYIAQAGSRRGDPVEIDAAAPS